jgi:hypothetical protein
MRQNPSFFYKFVLTKNKTFMKKITLLFLILLCLHVNYTWAQTTESTRNGRAHSAMIQSTMDETITRAVGFSGGNADSSWLIGDQENLNIWLKWCDLQMKEDVDGIMSLAGDSITIEGLHNEIIHGKAELKEFFTGWFENYDMIIKQEWGIPINFIDKDGNKDDGDWIINGHKLQTISSENVTREDNQANVYIKNSQVQFFKIYNHSTITTKLVSATFSVDMSGYEGEFKNVFLNGAFNNWCGSCNLMTDENKDGVYEITLDVPLGEIEYKFTLDGWNTQEVFEAGTPCTKTIEQFTNRVANLKSGTSLPVACFNTCGLCR